MGRLGLGFGLGLGLALGLQLGIGIGFRRNHSWLFIFTPRRNHSLCLLENTSNESVYENDCSPSRLKDTVVCQMDDLQTMVSKVQLRIQVKANSGTLGQRVRTFYN